MAISKFQEVERREGRPMREVLADMFDQYQTQRAVAEALGVSQGTISLWVKLCGLELRTVVVAAEEKTA